jgi:hypothetical protein
MIVIPEIISSQLLTYNIEKYRIMPLQLFHPINYPPEATFKVLSMKSIFLACSQGWMKPAHQLISTSQQGSGTKYKVVDKTVNEISNLLQAKEIQGMVQQKPGKMTNHGTDVGWSCYRGGRVSEDENLWVNFLPKKLLACMHD